MEEGISSDCTTGYRSGRTGVTTNGRRPSQYIRKLLQQAHTTTCQDGAQAEVTSGRQSDSLPLIQVNLVKLHTYIRTYIPTWELTYVPGMARDCARLAAGVTNFVRHIIVQFCSSPVISDQTAGFKTMTQV